MGWVRGEILGEGGFGFVSMATTHGEHNNLPPLIAVKSAKLSESKSLSMEKQFLDKFQACSCILRCFGDDVTVEGENKEKLYNLLLEYAAGGCLADRINVKAGLSENMVSRHTKSILTALIHMHKLGYVHCDVKPHNVLLVGLEEDAKLADFGSCQSCCDQNIHDDFRGTVLYAAPESITRQKYVPESDVWSLGCTVLHMLTGKSPWVIDKNKMDVKDVFLMIGYSSQIPHIPTNISKQAKDFLSKCLVKDPASRWTAHRLIHHPFLKLADNRHHLLLHVPSRLVPHCFHAPKVHAS